MPLTKRWAGRIFGTNTGNIFIKLEGEDDALTGTLRISEPGVVAVYSVEGTFDAPTLKLTGTPTAEIDGVTLGNLTATGTLNARGEIRGDWETQIGTGGTFHIFPHNFDDDTYEKSGPEQLHTARHNFGAIEIDRDGIVDLAESLQSDFPSVVVSVNTGTEQARYLDTFKDQEWKATTATLVRIFAQKQDAAGFNQSVTIEFGPQINWAMTQGNDEAWVLGKLETIKRSVEPYGRTYVTTYARWGISLNQFLLLTALVLLPSFETLRDRGIFMGTGLALLLGINWLHSKFLPFAAIHLKEKEEGWISKLGPSTISWASGILATVIGTLVGAYLLGVLDLDGKNADIPQIEAPTIKTTPTVAIDQQEVE
ncbi:MAG: hypothetical protein OSA41_04110 [Erythrobacter sp.]|jgi:hypothetical protein|uniref:hypothetical protein n=1 Tax=Qipengyuania citrea TaxID=225971 RepID=UPI001A438989|nr:hypothetical protein [Qipengyuania citrea]MBL4717442.1 hypothetical protein [Erythrobacter sp.]MCP2016784.1 hypothetical protein [Qipengyuania citrea]MDE0900883.1 hypothetical protein [Erythrobacter sp.]